MEYWLSVFGFSDTDQGRRHFDEFVCDFRHGHTDNVETEHDTDRTVKMTTTNQRHIDEVAWRKLLAATSAELYISQDALMSQRSRQATHARRVLLSAARSKYPWSYRAIGEKLGCQPTTLQKMAARTNLQSHNSVKLSQLS